VRNDCAERRVVLQVVFRHPLLLPAAEAHGGAAGRGALAKEDLLA
jgi:hypothetical protein